MNPALLEVDSVGKQFGGLVALSSVSFDVPRSSVVGLIGPNGSGKTTLLNVINGIYAPDRGSVVLDGVPTKNRSPSDLAASGVSRTFQNARVFSTLSVEQNLFIPLLHRSGGERAKSIKRADELLAFVGLEAHANKTAIELSGGQKRLLEFARALVTKPGLILMDEPFAGVHPQIKATLIRCIQEIVEREGASFLVVSHEVPDLVNLSNFMVCLVEGKVAAAGNPKDVVRNEKVIEGYLGQSDE
ncbi:MAG: ABC transporter ATP-binding protein [Bradyrhizobiaceae bacterium]|nr:ABC transporter ATP-binding protein [Bradyrhizobiaceae bacterium]